MARISPVKNKNGDVISYRIMVFRGKDENGRELTPYSTNWKIPPTYKSEKVIQDALKKIAGEFEAECKNGNVITDKRTLSEYICFYIKVKTSDKKKSVEFYNSLRPRIDNEIGHIKLAKLTGAHLDSFYLKLRDEDIRKDKKAIANEFLLELKLKNQLTNVEIANMSGLSSSTIGCAFAQKHISIESAQKIATAFNQKVDKLFITICLGGQVGLSAKSINHYHTFLHSVLQMAVKQRIIKFNPADGATPPIVVAKEADFFEIDEIIQIRDALDRSPLKYKVAICLLIDLGIRRGELFGIRWKDVDFSNSTIRIEGNIQWTKESGLYNDTPKGKKTRTITFSQEIIPLLKQYSLEQKKMKLASGSQQFNSEEYLFINDNGYVMYPSSLNHWVKRFEEREQLPHIYPHKFRHSQASILYASNIDPITISKRLGHKQVSTTQNIYAHMMKAGDQKAASAIADTLYKNHA